MILVLLRHGVAEGADGACIGHTDLPLARGESYRDTALVLSRFVSALLIRTYDQAEVETFAEHASILTGADARGPVLFSVQEEPGRWRVRQVLDDPEGDHDWAIGATVDLAASDEAGEAVVHVETVERLEGFTRG